MAEVASRIGTDVFTLRLELIDDWSVRHFENMLSRVRGSYDSLHRLDSLFGKHPPERPWPGSVVEMPRFFGGSFDRYRIDPEIFESDVPFEDLLTKPLRIKRIELASPGYVELIGSLNPLKIIADFISDYRAENTKRAEIQINASLKREEARSQISLRIWELMPEDFRVEHPERIAHIARTVIDPTFTSLERVAIDQKVDRVYLLESEMGDVR